MKLKFRADAKDIVIFLIFCVVLLYLVAIVVVNLHSVATTGEFMGLNPIPAFYTLNANLPLRLIKYNSLIILPFGSLMNNFIFRRTFSWCSFFIDSIPFKS